MRGRSPRPLPFRLYPVKIRGRNLNFANGTKRSFHNEGSEFKEGWPLKNIVRYIPLTDLPVLFVQKIT